MSETSIPKKRKKILRRKGKYGYYPEGLSQDLGLVRLDCINGTIWVEGSNSPDFSEYGEKRSLKGEISELAHEDVDQNTISKWILVGDYYGHFRIHGYLPLPKGFRGKEEVTIEVAILDLLNKGKRRVIDIFGRTYALSTNSLHEGEMRKTVESPKGLQSAKDLLNGD